VKSIAIILLLGAHSASCRLGTGDKAAEA